MNTYIHFSFFFGLFIIIIPYIAYIYGISIGNDPKERKKHHSLSFLWVIPFHTLLLTTIIKDNIT